MVTKWGVFGGLSITLLLTIMALCLFCMAAPDASLCIECFPPAPTPTPVPNLGVSDLYDSYGSWLGRSIFCQGYLGTLDKDKGFHGEISGAGALTFWSISGMLDDVNRYYYAFCDANDPQICIPAWTDRNQTSSGPFFARSDKVIKLYGEVTEAGFQIYQSYGW